MKNDRLAVLNSIAEQKVMHLFSTEDASSACAVADAIYAGGGRVIEFTNRARFAQEVFGKLRRHIDETIPDLVLGVGSVEDPASASAFMALGADFIVSPLFVEETAVVCNMRKVPYLPGTQTITEIATAERSGVEFVKLYPATDPSFVPMVRAPRPWTRIIANGPIDAESAVLWLEQGATAVGTMMSVPESAVESGDYDAIVAAVAEMTAAVDGVGSPAGGVA